MLWVIIAQQIQPNLSFYQYEPLKKDNSVYDKILSFISHHWLFIVADILKARKKAFFFLSLIILNFLKNYKFLLNYNFKSITCYKFEQIFPEECTIPWASIGATTQPRSQVEFVHIYVCFMIHHKTYWKNGRLPVTLQ